MTPWLLVLFSALAAPPAFEQALAAYDAQRYDEAVQQYEALVAEGAADPVLFYNLGNAYFRLENLAAAIANYERALQLDPRLGAARTNLERAVSATKRKLARPLAPGWQESLVPWDERLRKDEVRMLALMCWAAFWSVLFWRVMNRRKGQAILAAVLLAAACGFIVSLYAKSYPVHLAVANRDELEVRTGANPADTLRFTLSTGDRVRVEATDGEWLRVATVDGERGWAPAASFVQVGPPYVPAEKELGS